MFSKDPRVPERRDVDAERPQARNASALVEHADPGRLLTVPRGQQPADKAARRTNMPEAAHARPERDGSHPRPGPARQNDDLRIDAPQQLQCMQSRAFGEDQAARTPVQPQLRVQIGAFGVKYRHPGGGQRVVKIGFACEPPLRPAGPRDEKVFKILVSSERWCGDRIHEPQMGPTRSTAEAPFSLRQHQQSAEPHRLAHKQNPTPIDREMIDDLPEKWRRFGLWVAPNTEDERRCFIKQARCRDAHPEIGDHMAEMVADGPAPDASIHDIDRSVARQRAGIDRLRDEVPAMPCINLRPEMRPFWTAAEERARGMTQHLLRRMDDDVRERLHLVVEKGECATRHGASQQRLPTTRSPETAHMSGKKGSWPLCKKKRPPEGSFNRRTRAGCGGD